MKTFRIFLHSSAVLAISAILLFSCGKKKAVEMKVELLFEKSTEEISARGFILSEKKRFKNYAGFYLALDLNHFSHSDKLIQVTHEDKNGNVLGVVQGNGFPDPILCVNYPEQITLDSSKFSIWNHADFMTTSFDGVPELPGEKIFIPYSWLTDKKGKQVVFIGLRIYSYETDTVRLSDSAAPRLKEIYSSRFKIKCEIPSYKSLHIHLDSLKLAMDHSEAERQDDVLFRIGKHAGYPDPEIRWSIDLETVWVTPREDNAIETGNFDSPKIEYYKENEELFIDVVDEDMIGSDDPLGNTTTTLSEICRANQSTEIPPFGKIRLLRVKCLP